MWRVSYSASSDLQTAPPVTPDGGDGDLGESDGRSGLGCEPRGSVRRQVVNLTTPGDLSVPWPAMVQEAFLH